MALLFNVSKRPQDTLVACLTDNPRPILFPVSCFGAAPKMVLEGPWDKVLLAEQAALEGLGSPEVWFQYLYVRLPDQRRFGLLEDRREDVYWPLFSESIGSFYRNDTVSPTRNIVDYGMTSAVLFYTRCALAIGVV